jgi:AAA domain/Primase C terminal 2 (PriCT-2)
VIAPPSVKPGKDGGTYKWINDNPIADAPDWLIALVTAGDEPYAAEPRDRDEDIPDWFAAAAATLKNNDLNWGEWNLRGMAIWAAAGGEGAAAFDEFSRKSSKHNAKETTTRWKHICKHPPTKMTAGKLHYLAEEDDPDWRERFEDAQMDDARRASQEAAKEAIAHLLAKKELAGTTPQGESKEAQRKAETKTEAPPISIHATPFEWIEPAKIPPRQWVYKPHYIRQFVSAEFSPGGIGKTSLLTVEALAMATNQALLNIQPSQQLRVWYWNGEDPKEELDRRFAAACKHYNLTKEDIGDHLFVDSGRAMPIVIAEDTRSGTRIAVPVIKEIIATLIENRIDVLIIDPFVSCHRVAENDNAAIERVAKSWSNISEVADCSISLAHHVRKTGGESVTVEDGRGASALRDAVRTARTLNNMTAREAEDAEINDRDRQLYFRCDIGKRNLTRPAEKVDWFKLESVDLGNGPHLGGMGGDEVGVVTAWGYPKVDAPVITTSDIERVQAAINGGRWRADQRAKNEPWVGIAVAQVLGLDLRSKADKRAAAKLVDGWLRAGFLKQVVGQDSHFAAVPYIEVGAKPPSETPAEAPEPGVDGPWGAGNA